jgi:hypothetical protein
VIDVEKDTQLDQVLELLRGSGLELRASAVASVLAAYPDGNGVAAARTVLDWRRAGQVRVHDAAVQLRNALRVQRGRAARRDPVAHLAQLRAWAAEQLPELPEVLVVSALERERYLRSARNLGEVPRELVRDRVRRCIARQPELASAGWPRSWWMVPEPAGATEQGRPRARCSSPHVNPEVQADPAEEAPTREGSG